MEEFLTGGKAAPRLYIEAASTGKTSRIAAVALSHTHTHTHTRTHTHTILVCATSGIPSPHPPSPPHPMHCVCGRWSLSAYEHPESSFHSPVPRIVSNASLSPSLSQFVLHPAWVLESWAAGSTWAFLVYKYNRNYQIHTDRCEPERTAQRGGTSGCF